MAKETRRGSFRAKVVHNATQQRSKASNYGHLLLPRGVTVFDEEPGGRIALDVLPYFVTDSRHPDHDDEREVALVGTLWYRRPYKLHRMIGTQNASIVCPVTFGKKCPICEYRAKLLAEGAKWQDEGIKALRPSDRNLYYVVPKGSSKHDEKPHLWDISQFCFQEMLNNELDENDEFGDFPDLNNGLTLRIRFSEEKMGTNSFAKTSRIDFEARDYAYAEDLIKSLPSLDDALDAKDYREIERLFFETDGGDGDDKSLDRESEHPREVVATAPTTIGKGVTRPAVRPEPESEPDEEEEEEHRPAKPVQQTARQAALVKRTALAPAGKCPSGHEYATDNDAFPECEECPVWGECLDAKEAAAV